MNKKTLLSIIVSVLIIPSILALTGTSDSISDLRFAIGYVTFNSTESSPTIQAFGDEVSANLTGDGEGRLSQLSANFQPTSPILDSPENNSIFTSTPEFGWSNSTDPEGRALSYLFEMWNDTSLTDILFTNYSIVETANTTKTTPTITPEGTFYWRVAANDSVQNSTFSNIRTVTIDGNPPGNFNLTTPTDGTSSTDTTPTLEWQEASDPTLQNYTIEVSTSESFTTITRTEYSTTTSLTNWTTGPLAAGTYYWKVNATDLANNQRTSDNNLSFIVAATKTETTTTTTETTSGGGVKPFTLNIISPENIVINRNDEITIPLIVSNPSQFTIRGVTLQLRSDNSGLILSLDKSFIATIAARAQEKVLLTIRTEDIPTGHYGIIIDAIVNSPSFQDSTRILANLIETDVEAQGEVLDSIDFAKQLLNGNPECLDLSEYITQAELAIQNKQNDKAKSLAENAVSACKKILEQKEIFKGLTGYSTIINQIKSVAQSKNFLIIAPQVATLLILLSIVFYFVRKSKAKKREQTTLLILILLMATIFTFMSPEFTGFTIITLTDISSAEPFGNWSLGTFEETNTTDNGNNVTLNLTDGILTYALQGNYTSQIFSPGNYSLWTNLTITNTSEEGTNITFQVKSCSNSNCTEIFVGPDNTSDTFFEETTIILNETTAPNSTHFQFKALFHTNETSRTPILEEVNISYDDINDPPVNLTIQYPTENIFINSTNITIEISNATDIEDDPVTYYLEIYNDSSLTEINQVNSSIAETASPTTADVNLTEDGDYYLRILATDSATNSSFSEAVNFTIDTLNPTSFNLTSPSDGASFTDTTPTLEWNATTELNLQNYTVEVSTAADFATITRTESATTNELTNWSAGPLDPGTYYWKVRATDMANNQNTSENNLSFTIEDIVETQTQSVTKTSAGANIPKPYSFHIIAPPSITVVKDETIIIPLTIENRGVRITLNNIRLTAEANTPVIQTSLNKNLIPILPPSTNESLELALTAAEVVRGAFAVTIKADIESPQLTDSITIITSIAGKQGDNLAAAQQQLAFGKRFFDGNPPCEKLSSLLDQAEKEIKSENYIEANRLVEDAINRCKDLVATKPPLERKGLVALTASFIKENQTTTIVGAQILFILIIVSILAKRVLRKRKKEIELDF